jgi:hypothetical protein
VPKREPEAIWGYNWAAVFLGDIYKYGDLAFQAGEVSDLKQ